MSEPYVIPGLDSPHQNRDLRHDLHVFQELAALARRQYENAERESEQLRQGVAGNLGTVAPALVRRLQNHCCWISGSEMTHSKGAGRCGSVSYAGACCGW